MRTYMEIKKLPNSTANMDSHQVSPIATNDEIWLHDPAEIKSEHQYSKKVTEVQVCR
jgi:hypothetical protein